MSPGHNTTPVRYNPFGMGISQIDVRRVAYLTTVAAFCALALPTTATASTTVHTCRVAHPASAFSGLATVSTSTNCATAHAIFWAVYDAARRHPGLFPRQVVAQDPNDHVKLVIHVTVDRYTGTVMCTSSAPTHALVEFSTDVLIAAVDREYP